MSWKCQQRSSVVTHQQYLSSHTYFIDAELLLGRKQNAFIIFLFCVWPE